MIHVDIDPAEIGKNRAADLPIVGDVKRVLERINKVLKELAPADQRENAGARRAWWKQVREWKSRAAAQARILRLTRSSRNT